VGRTSCWTTGSLTLLGRCASCWKRRRFLGRMNRWSRSWMSRRPRRRIGGRSRSRSRSWNRSRRLRCWLIRRLVSWHSRGHPRWTHSRLLRWFVGRLLRRPLRWSWGGTCTKDASNVCHDEHHAQNVKQKFMHCGKKVIDGFLEIIAAKTRQN